MKKINANEKDRVICVSSSNGKQDFYFQQGKGERVWLFQSNFSGSVFNFFREHGHMTELGFSLTIRQIYSLKNKAYANVKITRIFDRLPGAVNYVIAYELTDDKVLPVPDEHVIYTLPDIYIYEYDEDRIA